MIALGNKGKRDEKEKEKREREREGRRGASWQYDVREGISKRNF